MNVFVALTSAATDESDDLIVDIDADLGKSRDASKTDDEAVQRCVQSAHRHVEPQSVTSVHERSIPEVSNPVYRYSVFSL